MDYGHPLRFGAFVTPSAGEPGRPVALARYAEEVGLDLVTFQDHPYQPAFLDTWTLLAWVAGETERIAISGNVLNVPMRPPAVLARAAASLDLLSDGRLELGLGAGWAWDAIAAMGGERRSPGEAVLALAEAIAVMRGLWDVAADADLRIDGEHYALHGAARGPAPARNVPIWVGALGPRMLRLVGTLADGWLPSLSRLEPGDLARGNVIIDAAARDAGRDPREVQRLLNVPVRDGDSVEWAGRLTRLALENGISTFVVASDDENVLRELAREIAPRVRDAVSVARAGAGVAASVVVPARVRERRRAGIDYDAVPAGLVSVEPGDPRFGALRANYLRGGSPGLVLLPSTAAQAGTALAFAGTQAVPLGIRSGGHGISGRSTNDGGIVLDLSRLDSIEVLDPAQRLVRVGAGARWGEVATTLEPRGWAISSGDFGGVGVGGLATAGGIGWLSRKHGLTIDRVRAVDVALADGSFARASAEENPDLFWAMRGAGGNVAVATAFEIEAAPVGLVGFAQLVVDASDIAGVLERWGSAVEGASRDLTSFLLLGSARPGQPPVAQIMAVVDSADPDTVVGHLEPLARVAPLLDQSVRIVPYSSVVLPAAGPHRGVGEPATRSSLVEHMSRDVALAAERVIRSGASFFFQVRAVGGAVGDVPAEATAYAHRSANFSIIGFGPSRARLDPAWDELHAFATGLYLSFETDPRPERLTDAFPPATLARLREVKRRFDPANVLADNFAVLRADVADDVGAARVVGAHGEPAR